VPESAEEHFQTEIDGLRAENASLVGDNATLRVENAALVGQIEVVRAENAGLTRRVDELTRRLGQPWVRWRLSRFDVRGTGWSRLREVCTI